MELIVGLVTMAVGVAAVVSGLWFAVRAFGRVRRVTAPVPAAMRVPADALRRRLGELGAHGLALDDDGGDRLVLRLPLLAARSAAGSASEEYRLVVTLDGAAGTARLSERRVGKEAGFAGAGLFRWSAWTAPTAGAPDRREAGGAAAPGGAGGSYRLDAAAARALVEQTIAAAGWRVR